LRQLISAHQSNALIEIDGGVDLNNAGKLKDVGADVLVAGNTVFGSEDPLGTIAKLKEM
jgi:ribulose-phosphate 3-epimerase